MPSGHTTWPGGQTNPNKNCKPPRPERFGTFGSWFGCDGQANGQARDCRSNNHNSQVLLSPHCKLPCTNFKARTLAGNQESGGGATHPPLPLLRWREVNAAFCALGEKKAQHIIQFSHKKFTTPLTRGGGIFTLHEARKFAIYLLFSAPVRAVWPSPRHKPSPLLHLLILLREIEPLSPTISLHAPNWWFSQWVKKKIF